MSFWEIVKLQLGKKMLSDRTTPPNRKKAQFQYEELHLFMCIGTAQINLFLKISLKGLYNVLN